MTDNLKKIVRFISTLDEMNKNWNEQVPGLIMSDPGEGKTTFIKMYCKAMGYGCVTLIASQYSPDDVTGLQSVQNGKLERLSPDWYNDLMEASDGDRNRCILFIDELTTCNEFIQSALLAVIYDRKVGHKFDLPKNLIILAAGNYSEQLNSQFSLMMPTVNRFMILNVFSDMRELSSVTMDDLDGLSPEESARYLEFDKMNKNNVQKLDVNGFSSIINEVYGSFNIDRVISKMKNSAIDGLLGVCTKRTYKYSMRYLTTYGLLYDNSFNLMTQVLGDTLGIVPEGGSYEGGLKMSKILKDKLNRMMITSPSTKGKSLTLKGLKDLLKERINNPNSEISDELKKYFSEGEVTEEYADEISHYARLHGREDRKLEEYYLTEVINVN